MTLPSPPKSPPSSADLIKLYKKAQQDLIDEIIVLANKGNISTAKFKKALLDKVNITLEKLLEESKEWSEEAIPEAYRLGVLEADADILEAFKAAGVDPPKFPPTFSVIDNEVVAVLLEGVNDNFDQIAATTQRTLEKKFTTGQTLKQAQAQLLETLEKEGMTAFTFKRNGKDVNLPLSSYTETVIRSTTAEVTNQASIRRTMRGGGDLVKMTSHLESCPICWPLQGRVYSISGTDPEYPPLETAFSGQHANIHPNCRHRLKPYILELKTPAEIKKDKAFSNRPFEIEDMSKEQQAIFNRQIKAYNAGQEKNRKLNANRKQFNRYQARLGEDAPKTFSSFMRAKNADSKKWEDLQSDFRSAGKIKPDKIKPKKLDKKDFASLSKKEQDKMFNDFNDSIFDDIPEANIQSLADYTDGGYIGINTDLRDGLAEGGILDEINNIDFAIQNTPGLPSDTKLFRGMKDATYNEAFNNGDLSVGDVIFDEGFMSTSLNQSITQDVFSSDSDRGVLYEILAPEGTQGIFMEPVTFREGEQEWLLPRDTNLEILEIDTSNPDSVRVIMRIVEG